MTSIDLSVITVSNNHQPYLQRCLGALLKSDCPFPFEIFVVDNASRDTTVTFVRANFPQIKLIAGETRRGFSANNNLAIRQSTGRFILLINPDTEVTPTALTRLVRFMDDHPEVGICGPQLRYPDDTIQLSCRAFPTLGSVLARRTPLRIFLRDSKFNKKHLLAGLDHTKDQEVDWLLGAALMIRRETLNAIGSLDEHYFLYVEDIDFCLRAHQHGWHVYYLPEAIIIHHHLAVSDRKFFSKHSYYHSVSMLYYLIKYKVPGGKSLFRYLGERLIDFLNDRAK